ncbi:MAG: ribosome maturation factor RimM [Actinomycetota bacterium]
MAGEIGKPHGLSGEVYVLRISDDPARFERGARLIHETGRKLVVAESRPHHNRLLVRFEDVDSRTEAEELRGALYVTPADLRALEEDEFWEHDLVGCKVVLANGHPVGRAERVIKGPAQDLLAVETPGGERLIPIVKAVVVDVNIDDQRIIIDPPEGLLD